MYEKGEKKDQKCLIDHLAGDMIFWFAFFINIIYLRNSCEIMSRTNANQLKESKEILKQKNKVR